MSHELRILEKRERQLRNNLNLIDRFLQNFTKGKDECQLCVRLQILDEANKEFYAVRSKIELLLEDICPTDEEAEDKEEILQQQEKANYQVMQDFDDRYCTLKTELLKLQSGHNLSKANVEQGAGSSIISQSRVKLPEIQLPSFSGNLSEWITFRDSFRSLIHQNNQLTDVDKFTYLRSALTEEARQEINSIELSAANYEIAWKALYSRYENRKLIVKTYLDAIFKTKPLGKEGYNELSQLISGFEKNLQMLEKIGENTTGWSTILVHMVCSKLDVSTLRHWETHHSSKEVPTFKDLMTFLRNQSSVLQSVMSTNTLSSVQQCSRSSTEFTLNKFQRKCLFCDHSFHSAFQCATFQNMSITERNSVVSINKLCRNCLRPGHRARVCERGVCHYCSQKHHSMLHTTSESIEFNYQRPQSTLSTATHQLRQPLAMLPMPNRQTDTQTHQASAATINSRRTNSSTPPDNAVSSQTYVALPVKSTPNIIMPTALVSVIDQFGNSMLARALLDSCSQHCFISKSFSKKLKLQQTKTYLAVKGVGTSCNVSTNFVIATVTARSGIVSTFAEKMRFYILPHIAATLPTENFDPSRWNLPHTAVLADPMFNVPASIDMIIGAEFYLDILRTGNYRATSDGPTLQNTAFGWLVSGRVHHEPTNESSVKLNVTTTALSIPKHQLQSQQHHRTPNMVNQNISTMEMEKKPRNKQPSNVIQHHNFDSQNPYCLLDQHYRTSFRHNQKQYRV